MFLQQRYAIPGLQKPAVAEDALFGACPDGGPQRLAATIIQIGASDVIDETSAT